MKTGEPCILSQSSIQHSLSTCFTGFLRSLGLLIFLWVAALPVKLLGQDEFSIVGSRVLYVMDPHCLEPGGEVRAEAVDRMVNSLLIGLTGRPTATSAWKSLLHEDEVVGIKVSASGQKASGTRLATVMAVVRGLRAAGFSREQIVVWDRNRQDLLASGFSESSPDYELQWIDPADGYDEESPVSAPILGKLIWGDSKFVPRSQQRFADLAGGTHQLSSQSYVSNVLSRKVTRVIHIPSLQDSFLTGINGALAGMVLHNLDNWRRFTTAPFFGDPYLAEIYATEVISGKVVLTLLDGLFLQFAGGPFPNPAQTVENFTIFASYDPVALDATARRLINEVRAEHRLPDVNSQSGYIESAALLGLGVEGEDKILMRRITDGGSR